MAHAVGIAVGDDHAGVVQEAVEEADVLSQFAAEPDSPVRFLRWHAAVERRIRELGTGYTFLRPNLFFQGLLAAARTIAASSRLLAPSATPR